MRKNTGKTEGKSEFTVDPIYLDHYNRNEVKYEIVKQLMDREICMISSSDSRIAIRHIRMHTVKALDFWLNKLNTHRRCHNMYMSLAKYRGSIPYRNPNLSIPIDTEYWNESWKHISSFDFMVDIDQDDHTYEEIEYGIESASKIKNELDRLNCPYHFIHSGRGYHIIVPGHLFTNTNREPGHEKSVYSDFQKILKAFRHDHTEMIDTGMTAFRRVRKIPYTLAHYHDRIRLCYPINSQDEWDYVKIDYEKMAEPNRLYGKMFNRGVKLWNAEGNTHNLMRQYVW